MIFRLANDVTGQQYVIIQFIFDYELTKTIHYKWRFIMLILFNALIISFYAKFSFDRIHSSREFGSSWVQIL